jgi:hypothetical protein
VLALFAGVQADLVKEYIHATYNGSGQAFVKRWCVKAKVQAENLPSYLTELRAEVDKMGDIDLQDTALVDKLKAAGFNDDTPQNRRKLRCRAVFVKNEEWEAENRKKVVAAYEDAGISILAFEHDGTPVVGAAGARPLLLLITSIIIFFFKLCLLFDKFKKYMKLLFPYEKSK